MFALTDEAPVGAKRTRRKGGHGPKHRRVEKKIYIEKLLREATPEARLLTTKILPPGPGPVIGKHEYYESKQSFYDHGTQLYWWKTITGATQMPGVEMILFKEQAKDAKQAEWPSNMIVVCKAVMGPVGFIRRFRVREGFKSGGVQLVSDDDDEEHLSLFFCKISFTRLFPFFSLHNPKHLNYVEKK